MQCLTAEVTIYLQENEEFFLLYENRRLPQESYMFHIKHILLLKFPTWISIVYDINVHVINQNNPQ